VAAVGSENSCSRASGVMCMGPSFPVPLGAANFAAP
jgi:hypothetical protein